MFPNIEYIKTLANGIRTRIKANEHRTANAVKNGDDFIILTSPNGTKYQITVGDDGVLTTTAVTE